jgi:peptidoglycan/xylan/chitin deacetylase (PgdA/CDA1 family)
LKPVVLCYHAVSAASSHRLALTPTQLERQVRGVLRRGYRGGTAAEAVAGRGRVLHVTFDDAYRNVADALPVLAALGVHVTVFACTDFADGGRVLDIPELAEDARREPDTLATMDWDALRALLASGVGVGSHTCGHPHLPLLGDAELARELTESRQRLEDELEVPCRYLAYPYGETDARVEAAAAAAGYDAAFALGPRRWGSAFAVPRVDLYRADDALRTVLKTTPAWHVAAAAAALVRRRR